MFNFTKNVSMYYKKQKIGKKWYPRSFTAGNANGQGVDTPEEVSPKQFRKVTVAFIPEYSRAQNNRIQQRIIVPSQVEWTEMEGTVKK